MPRQFKTEVLREFAAFVHHGRLLFACLLKRGASEDLTSDLQLPPPTPERDRLLRPEQAAETLGVSRQYFYDHESELPFVVRLNNGVLRVSEQGMLSWIEQQTGGQRCVDSETSTSEKVLDTGGSDTASTESRSTRARSRRRNPTPPDS